MSMLTGMLTGNQKQTVDLFKNKTTQQQAEEVARKCNELGITKEQLQGVIDVFKR